MSSEQQPSLSSLSLTDNPPGLTRAETPRAGQHADEACVATPQPTGAELEELAAVTTAEEAQHHAHAPVAAAAVTGLSMSVRSSGSGSNGSTSNIKPSPYPAALGPPTSQAGRGGAITGAEVDADPILQHIAHTQPAATPFRARPAPASTHYEGVGPRLTKSAALRQGLEWEDPRDLRRATLGTASTSSAGGGSDEGGAVSFDNVPGHKRTGLNLNVDSLAEPALAPRQNRAALLRQGIKFEEPVRDTAAIAAANKARDAEERAARRRSVQLPVSLTNPAPESLPRQNRAALLRLGQVPTAHGRDPKEVAEQAILNKEREAAERLAKRKSVALPASLAAPSIAPRLNRSSMLRTGDAVPTPRAPQSRPMSMFAPKAADNAASKTTAERFAADKAEKAARRASMTPLRSLAAPVIAPRTNRASVLRTDKPAAAVEKPAPIPLSRTTSTSSLTSMSVRTTHLNPAPPKPAPPPMLSPRSKYLAPRPAPVPPRHRPSASVSSASRSSSPGSDKRNSIFQRLSLKPSTGNLGAGSGSSSGGGGPAFPRPTKSSLLREGLGAKIGKATR